VQHEIHRVGKDFSVPLHPVAYIFNSNCVKFEHQGPSLTAFLEMRFIFSDDRILRLELSPFRGIFSHSSLCRALRGGHNDTSLVVIRPFSMESLPLGGSTATADQAADQPSDQIYTCAESMEIAF
jgi:hypothetical protein